MRRYITVVFLGVVVSVHIRRGSVTHGRGGQVLLVWHLLGRVLYGMRVMVVGLVWRVLRWWGSGIAIVSVAVIIVVVIVIVAVIIIAIITVVVVPLIEISTRRVRLSE